MKIKQTLVLLLFSIILSAQSIPDLLNQIDATNLNQTLNEFSGETPTLINGNSTTILNRQSNQNDDAANYLIQKLEGFGNLSVEAMDYSTNGTNIIAFQQGDTNPEDTYILCAHYDSVTDFCANDNATGTAAVLEVARVLSQYCIENNVIYAFFDEEEDGLLGSEDYVNFLATSNLNILGVINLDMIGYDANQNDDAPIHVRDIAASIGLKNAAEDILSTYNSEIALTPTVVNPGIDLSDHRSFWNSNYTAIMISDPASISELSPFYHTSADKVSTLDLPYFFKMTKFVAALVFSRAVLVSEDDCELVSSLAINEGAEGLMVFPNPTTGILNVFFEKQVADVSLTVRDAMGKIVFNGLLSAKKNNLDVGHLQSGVYWLSLENGEEFIFRRIILF